jgi:REP element-mobilizing transposase RayT
VITSEGKGAYRLHRYVVMPDHIHVLLTPGEVISLERAVQYIQGGSSREIGRVSISFSRMAARLHGAPPSGRSGLPTARGLH